MSLKSVLRKHQSSPGVRIGLDLVQSVYSRVEKALDRDGTPAIDGGRPVRCLPLPPPRPITHAERKELRRLARSQSTSFFDGTMVAEFEAKIAAMWGGERALATSSGTAALHTALMAAEIGPGDEVIVPVLTYVATAMAVRHAGATPRFVDVDRETWNISVCAVEAAITDRTRAIIPVHIGGVACDMRGLKVIAKRHGLFLIEDAAHAHGARYEGRFCGTLGDIGCFSFGSPKSVTTGEGGAVLLPHGQLANRARMAMNLGECAPDGQPSMDIDFFSPEMRLDYAMVGWNYRMSVAQAALGLGQLSRFKRIAERRTSNGRYLHAELAKIQGIQPQAITPLAEPCYYCLPLRLTEDAPLSRGELLAGLAEERIDFRLLSNLPLSEHEVFEQPGDFPVATDIARHALALRVDPALGRSEMEDTVRAIRRLMKWSSRKARATN